MISDWIIPGKYGRENISGMGVNIIGLLSQTTTTK